MTAKPIVFIALITTWIIVGSKASAAIPLETERALQRGAPEKLLIEVQDVRKRNGVLVHKFEVTAKVTAVEESDTGVKVGDVLNIRYWLHKPTVTGHSGSYPIEVKKGKRYRAYLGPPNNAYRDMDDKAKKIYFPSAASGSFDAVVTKKP